MKDILQDLNKWEIWVAFASLISIALHFILIKTAFSDLPLLVMLTVGGIPLLVQVAAKLLRGDFGADLMAIIALITAAILGEYLAGVLIIIMLAGGQALGDLWLMAWRHAGPDVYLRTRLLQRKSAAAASP